jgi:dTDP-4-dehydrorhamnose 3,5-epimerase
MPKVRKHKTYKDDRGSFTPIDLLCGPKSVDKWLQANISVNPEIYTFRGMHYQAFETAQNKYVKVIQGKIIDFLYDLETKEVEWYYLNDQEAIFVPKTKAHGFLTLKPNTIVTYLIDNHYTPEHDHSIPWHSIPNIVDIIVNIVPHVNDIVISDKDKLGQ